ncbi:MAG: SufD family Fe-S cluster assembly protein [Oscillospiraceae bacterium]
MNQTDNELLRQIADMDGVPASGAYNIRKNSQLECRGCSENIEITTKEDKTGIDIKIKAGTKGEAVHIPVLITETGLDELVYNDFFIGENCDVDIVAGCGIHNPGEKKSQHDGIHTFYVGKNSKVRYAEKHYGEGEGSGKRIMNPQTIVYLEEGSSIMLDTTQIRGVDQTKRYTKIVVGKNAEAVITEKLLTHADQLAESEMDVILQGEGSSARVISRSVAQNDSQQIFYPRVVGETKCFGHVQCDAIIMDNAKIKAIPAITANHMDAQLIHEAAIGRIAGDQIMKLMTLGLTEKEAEEKILDGFLQ